MKEAFTKIVENFAKLINVKTIVTFVTMAVFTIMALQGVFEADTVQTVVIMVLTYYFAKPTATD